MARHRRHSRRMRHRRHRHTRRHRGGNGLFSYLYNPFSQAIGAADDLTGAATNTVRGFVHTGLSGVNRAGRKLTQRANKVVSGLMLRKGRRSHRRRR